MTDEKLVKFSALCLKSAQSHTLKNVVFSSPVTSDAVKIKGVLKDLSHGTVLQLEYSLSEGRVKQENVSIDKVAEKVSALAKDFSHCDLNDSGGSASVLVSKKGKISLITHGNIGGGNIVTNDTDHEKNYILDGSEQFLVYLGISDKNGRVHDKKQAKYRQINRFLEYVGDTVKYLPRTGIIRIADLCCGKSYLSFAVYHYFTSVLGRSVIMDCVDLKASVMDYCADIASKCGFSGMSFTAGDVSKYSPDSPVHMVISLHACDVATDIVIDRAIAIGVEVILSTPCCHRDLSRKIDCKELKFISDNSVLKSKFCDAATDSLRILRLKACGYTADATEFTDPEDTPKNVLIRAHKDRGFDFGRRNNYANEYKSAYRFLCNAEAPILPDEVNND